MHPFGLIILGTLTLLGMVWVRSRPPAKRRKAVFQLALLVLVPTLLYMAMTGKLHWLGAIIAALLPFARRLLPLLRFLPILRGILNNRSNNPNHRSDGNRSNLDTSILSMTLDHDSGVMYGTVQQGPLKGKELGDLSEQEFIELLSYCRQQDEESTRVLEAYLNKRFGDRWHQDDPQQQSRSTNSDSHHLTDQDAWEVLGLTPGASKEEIIHAHRKLMQKVHPDRGGNHYLAAKINEAKERLLENPPN